MRSRFHLITSLLLLAGGAFSTVNAELLENIESEVGIETRYFFEDGLSGQDKFHPSLRAEVEYAEDQGDDSYNVVLFGRLDKEDSERTHADVREASWTHVGSDFELKAGVSKVFWGVTESRHLVDIVNQTDLVENIDGEDKLGQAMVKLSTEQDWGTVDLFWLPHFRERTFVGEDGRLGTPFVVDTDNAVYDSGAEEWRSDVAFRYSHYIDDLEFAVSHFSGTSRDPELISNNNFLAPKLLPFYQVIDQTGLEIQYIYEEWLFKLEGVTSSGPIDRYSAAVFGFEYTQIGIFDSYADLGWLLEFLFDDRNEKAPHSFEEDVFVGWRYAFNDADSSEILAGVIYDPDTHESLYSLEVGKRITNDLKINAEARVFAGGSTDDMSEKTWFVQDEDHIQLELVKYF